MRDRTLLPPNDPDHDDGPERVSDAEAAAISAEARRRGRAAWDRLSPDEQRRRIAEEVAW
jgi:hypothetical protein